MPFGHVPNWSPDWPISKYGVELESWSAFVLVQVENPNLQGFVFVIDHSFGDNAYTKLISGRRKGDEGPLQTACRELEEEAGIAVSETRMLYHGCDRMERPVPHHRFLFSISITDAESMRANSRNKGNEGEEPEYFSIQEFQRLIGDKEFFPPHCSMLAHANLLD